MVISMHALISEVLLGSGCSASFEAAIKATIIGCWCPGRR